jgi:hypothetical protein
MKKSPLKGADQTLVQGAYRAAMAGHRGQDAMSQGMDELTDIAMKSFGAIKAKRDEKVKEGDDLADSILEIGGHLGTSWLGAAQDEVEGMHSQYAKDAQRGRKKKTAAGMQDLTTFSQEVAAVKDLNTMIAEAQNQKDWSNSLTDKEQNVFNKFMDNNSEKRVHTDKDGKRSFQVKVGDGDGDDAWMSTKDIERMAGDHKKDYKTMTDIRQQAIDVMAKGKDDAKRNKEEGYTGGGYDVTKATAQMDNTLRNANLKSLMHDDVLENGKPWVTAVEENPEITGMTYESLGLPTPKGDDGIIGNEDDPQGAQSVLSGEHRGLIVDALTNPDNDLYDEERTRGMMAGYFTGFVNTQYDNEYDAGGGKYTSDSKGQFGETAQEQADNFMKEKGIK